MATSVAGRPPASRLIPLFESFARLVVRPYSPGIPGWFISRQVPSTTQPICNQHVRCGQTWQYLGIGFRMGCLVIRNPLHQRNSPQNSLDDADRRSVRSHSHDATAIQGRLPRIYLVRAEPLGKAQSTTTPSDRVSHEPKIRLQRLLGIVAIMVTYPQGDAPVMPCGKCWPQVVGTTGEIPAALFLTLVYQRQIDRGKHHLVALTHVANKMLHVVFSVMKKSRSGAVRPTTGLRPCTGWGEGERCQSWRSPG